MAPVFNPDKIICVGLNYRDHAAEQGAQLPREPVIFSKFASALTGHGKPIDRVAEGFHARVVQHEVDHLDGILYPMRMTDMSRFGFTAELFPGEDIADD